MTSLSGAFGYSRSQPSTVLLTTSFIHEPQYQRKGNSLRNSTKETCTSSEAATRGSSHRPHGRVNWILGKVKGSIKDGVNKLRTRSKDSHSRSPVPPHDHASSTPDIEVHAAPSDAADLQSVIRDTQQAAKRIHLLSGPAITVASAGQDAQADLNTIDDFQDTYLEPLRIFDTVIREIANVHPYAKMALGVLSWAAKIVIAQANRDEALLKLLKKLSEDYSFITQDEMLD